MVAVGERRLEFQRGQPAGQQIAKNPAEHGADQADQQRLDDEDRPDGLVPEAERFQDRDVAGLLVGDGGNDVVGAEARDQQDGADDGVHQHVAQRDRRQQILLRLLPGNRFVAGLLADPLADQAGLHRIAGAHPDFVDDAGLLFQNLRGLEQDVARWSRRSRGSRSGRCRPRWRSWWRLRRRPA